MPQLKVLKKNSIVRRLEICGSKSFVTSDTRRAAAMTLWAVRSSEAFCSQDFSSFHSKKSPLRAN